MSRIRTIHQDEWDDAFWNSNHEFRKTKSEKHRHKAQKSSTIRQGINDYFEKSKLKRETLDNSENWLDPDDFEE